jgi:hypothetical protein
VLLHTRNGFGGSGVRGGLDHVALHNAAFLLGQDIEAVVQARTAGKPPRFSKL